MRLLHNCYTYYTYVFSLPQTKDTGGLVRVVMLLRNPVCVFLWRMTASSMTGIVAVRSAGWREQIKISPLLPKLTGDLSFKFNVRQRTANYPKVSEHSMVGLCSNELSMWGCVMALSVIWGQVLFSRQTSSWGSSPLSLSGHYIVSDLVHTLSLSWFCQWTYILNVQSQCRSFRSPENQSYDIM